MKGLYNFLSWKFRRKIKYLKSSSTPWIKFGVGLIIGAVIGFIVYNQTNLKLLSLSTFGFIVISFSLGKDNNDNNSDFEFDCD